MAAGEGFKEWQTGDVLTANDVNGYLNQGIWVFDDAADRTAQVTSPQEGNFSYLRDTNKLYYYTGSAWAEADTSGILPSEFTAKGDLLAGTGNATFDNLPVGTNGQILVANSLTTTGLEWASPAAGGGYTLINTGGTALTGSSTGVTSIPNTYKDLIIQVVDYYPNADADINLYFNNDNNSANYQGIGFRSSNNAVDNGSRTLTGNQVNNSSAENTATIYIPNYANTDAYKLCYHMARARNPADNAYNIGFYVTGWNNTAAIDSFYLAAVSSTFSGGTMYVYGVK
jgi:hypothetical protein